MELTKINDSRIEIFDIAKGIAIITVILGHVIKRGCVFNFISLFHMVFFFVLAGYFFKEKYYRSIDSVKEFILKKLYRLLVPYLFFRILFTYLHNFFIKIHFYTTDVNFPYITAIVEPYTDLKTPVKAFFTHGEPLLIPSWFLFVLFVSLVLYAGASYVCRKIKLNFEFNKFFIALLFLNLGYYCAVKHIKVLYICTILSVTICFYIGEKFSQTDIKKFLNKWYFLLSAVILILINIILRKPVAISSAGYNNPALLVLLSSAGFIFVMSIADFVKKFPFAGTLEYIGQNTIPIILLHPVCFKAVTFIQILIYNEPVKNLASFYAFRTSLFWTAVYIGGGGILMPLFLDKIYRICKRRINESRF